MMRLALVILCVLGSSCAATMRNVCKQSCLQQEDRCRKSSQGAVGTACDQDLNACLSRC